MKKNILTVDGMGITKIELSSILKDYDINVVAVANEIEALSVLHEEKININAVIWTVNFVDELDFSAIRGMKRRGKHKHIPVIIISRFTDKSHIIRAIEAGVSEYIVKPYDDTVLLNKVLRALELPYTNHERVTEDVVEFSLFSFSDMYNKEYKAAGRGGYPLRYF
jgi:PleD family two-component response regulator